MDLATKFPPLYECSKCGAAVRVTRQGEGVEPIKDFSCEHVDAIIWANRKVVLRGKGTLSSRARIKLSMRQFLSLALKRSV